MVGKQICVLTTDNISTLAITLIICIGLYAFAGLYGFGLAEDIDGEEQSGLVVACQVVFVVITGALILALVASMIQGSILPFAEKVIDERRNNTHRLWQGRSSGVR